jgi:hypothetical protein
MTPHLLFLITWFVWVPRRDIILTHHQHLVPSLLFFSMTDVTVSFLQEYEYEYVYRSTVQFGSYPCVCHQNIEEKRFRLLKKSSVK